MFAGVYNHSPGGLHFEYAFYSLRSPAEPRENDLAHSLLAERMGNPKSAPHPHPPPRPTPTQKRKKTQTHDFLSTLKPPTAVCKGKPRLR